MKLKFVLLVGALAGAVFWILPLGSVAESVRLKMHGVRTEGTVLGRTKKSSKSELSEVTVTFRTPDGNQVTAKAPKRNYVAAGDKVTIWVDPEFPEKIDFGDTTGYNMRGVTIGGLIFGSCLFLFIRCSLKDKANRKLIHSGMRISAELISIERNEKYRMGDNNPWIIRCKWVNNDDNKQYLFTSQNYTIDPTPFLSGKSHLDIFIDPADPSKYWIDTSFMPKV
jgi:hypothetical protein